ncbi:SPASM domain-containing protein [Oscillospiraceae bacterium 50-16]|jgi:radical SAM protein with 4Fe4S-binding SPASM domain
MKMRKDKDFISFFNETTGHYVRSGIIKNGVESAEDPFMASFPELLDVGIMGHCRHGQSGLCLQAGVECYQDGLHANAPNMALEDFEEIVRQCRGKTYQIALGGCGDPDQHEHFADILETCHQAGIVPNFTTSGLGLNSELAQLCKKHCGAVAVSWYRSTYTLRAIDLLFQADVKTNIHYVVSNSTIEEAVTRLKERSFPVGVNAIVFLLHKPVGLGSQAQVLKCDDLRVKEFLELACGGNHGYKIGFDSCSIPGLISQSIDVNQDSVDTCEGARWSAYITSDMLMLPCSFDNQSKRWAVDLRSHTIQEAWDSSVFEDFRRYFRQSCPDCEHRSACMGGCPICREVVLCPGHTS